MRLTTKKFQKILENLGGEYRAISVQFFVEQFWTDFGEDAGRIELFEALRQNIIDRNKAINRVKPSLKDGQAREQVEGYNERIEKIRERLRQRIRHHLNKLDERGVVDKCKDGRKNLYYLQ